MLAVRTAFSTVGWKWREKQTIPYHGRTHCASVWACAKHVLAQEKGKMSVYMWGGVGGKVKGLLERRIETHKSQIIFDPLPQTLRIKGETM
jgi:hypothetical protein